MKKIIAGILLASSMLAGCGIFPTINCNNTPHLKIGMTEKELTHLMGDPYFSSISMKAGKIDKKTLGWQNKESPVESTNLIRVHINSDGRVDSFTGKCDSQKIQSN